MRSLVVALALALLLVASQAFAGGAVYGLKGGLSIANLGGDDAGDVDSRMVGCFGGFVEIPINEMISFQPEALYAMKGSKDEEGENTCTTKLTYIEIPMLFKVNIPTSGGIKPFIAAGPAVAFKLSATWEGTENDVPFDEDIEDVKGTDLGLIIGGGVGFPFMNRTAMLEGRYDLGLTTIVDVEDVDVKNNVISVLVGIAF
ncbi:MAG: porin family protein [bacterium]